MSDISQFTTAQPYQFSGQEPANQIDTKFTFAQNATTPTYAAGNALDLVGTVPLALITSDDWIGGDITFQTLPLYSQFIPSSGVGAMTGLAKIYDESDTGTPYKITTQSGRGYYRLPPTLFQSVSKLVITSSAAQSNANGAVVYVVAQPLFIDSK